MVSPVLRPFVGRTRSLLRSQVRQHPAIRRIATTAARELQVALGDDIYDGSYFGAGRDPLDRMGLSGYERYDRDTSNANIAAYMIWRWFSVQRTLDVGCATGFVVEALRELGMQSEGADVSQWAIDHAAKGAAGHLFFGDLTDRVAKPDNSYELISALETLEHLPPDVIEGTLKELRRLCSGYVIATIPSFGQNSNGPGGWFDVKVKPERLDYYRSLGPSYEGPVPYEDLYRDAAGAPIEGHLTIASFSWWTKQFEKAGFTRCAQVEREIHPHLARFGLTKYWNLYVFRVPSAPEPGGDVRSPDEIADVERRFGIDDREASEDDLLAVKEALGQ